MKGNLKKLISLSLVAIFASMYASNSFASIAISNTSAYSVTYKFPSDMASPDKTLAPNAQASTVNGDLVGFGRGPVEVWVLNSATTPATKIQLCTHSPKIRLDTLHNSVLTISGQVSSASSANYVFTCTLVDNNKTTTAPSVTVPISELS